jgi:hypothetical protein
MIVAQFEFAMPLVLEIGAGDGMHQIPSDVHAVIADDAVAEAGICPVWFRGKS